MSADQPVQDRPPEVAWLVSVVSSIPGVRECQLERIFLPEINVSDLALPGPIADLPIAAIRRTDGGLPEELLVSIDFRIERNEVGLKALEFLSWWVRDQSRAGANVQIRSIGLPPVVGNQKQLGTTLRFTIDWFYADPSQDIEKLLGAIGKMAKDLEQNLDFYRAAF
jgi:hypothetical protein